MRLLNQIAFGVQLQEMDGDFETDDRFELQFLDGIASCLESVLKQERADYVWVWFMIEVLRNEVQNLSLPMERDLFYFNLKILIMPRLTAVVAGEKRESRTFRDYPEF
jgi:hypothetical protein